MNSTKGSVESSANHSLVECVASSRETGSPAAYYCTLMSMNTLGARILSIISWIEGL